MRKFFSSRSDHGFREHHRRLMLEPLEERALLTASPLPLPGEVSGDLDSVGAFDLYTMEVTAALAGEPLFFELDTQDDSERNELYVRFGVAPTQTEFDFAANDPNEADQILELTGTQTGTYYVMVRATRAYSDNDPYTLRVDTTSSLPALALPGEVSGDLDSVGAFDLYTMEVTAALAGEPLFFELDTQDDSERNELYVRFGVAPTQTEFDFAANDPNEADQILELTGTQTGTYYVMVRATRAYSDNDPYTLRVDTTSSLPALALPGEVSGDLDSVGAFDLYTMEVTAALAGEPLFFELDTQDDSERNELYVRFGVAPTQTEFDFAANDPNEADQILELTGTQTGTYYVMVRATRAYSDNDPYTLRVDTTSSLPALALPGEVSGDLDSVGAFDLYTMEVTAALAGEPLFFELDTQDDSERNELYVRFGVAPTQTEFDFAANDPNEADQILELTGTQTGTYYVMVRATRAYSDNDPYTLRVDTTSSLPALALPGEVSGDLDSVGAFDLYTMEVTAALAGEPLFFELDTQDDSERNELYVRFGVAPTQTEFDFAANDPNEADQILELTGTQTGTYYVMVRATRAYSDNDPYTLRVDTTSSLPALALPGEVSGDLDSVGAFDLYTMEVTAALAGEPLFFELDTQDDSERNELYVRFGVAPTQTEFDFAANDPNEADQILELTGTQTGTYYVMVRATRAYSDNDPYTLRVDTTSSLPALALPGEVSGDLDSVGAFDLYTMEVTAALAGEPLFFELDTQDDSERNELYVRFGVAPTQTEFDFAANDPNEADQILELTGTQTGTYYVMVRATRAYSDNDPYTLRVDTTSSLPALALPGEVSGDLLHSEDFHLYRMDARAGQLVTLNMDITESSARNELFVRRDTIPTRDEFDFAATDPEENDYSLAMPITETGTYFVLVRASYAPWGLGYTLAASLDSMGGVWHDPKDSVPAPVNRLDVFFPRDVNPASFSRSDDVIRFVGPNGDISLSNHAWTNPQALQLTFPAQSAAGVYELTLGPQVLDTSGNAMDLDLDGVTGEIPDDRYVAEFAIPAPKIIAHEPVGTMSGQIEFVTLHFDLMMDTSSFAAADIVSFSGPSGPIALEGFQWLDSQTLELAFQPLNAAGEYEIILGTGILDSWGNPLDQDGDFVVGEAVDDQYVATFHISAPRITHHSPDDSTTGPVSSVRISFDQSMDETSFSTSADVVLFVGPSGPIQVTNYTWKGSRTLELQFSEQTVTGAYELILGPGILDAGGNPLDQDGDGLLGETGDDGYRAGFSVALSGTLDGDTIWSPNDGVILIEGYVSVPEDTTLRIEPGTIVKFVNDGRISVHGVLDARGTLDEPIVFTAIQDDTIGGDTNQDADATSPTAGSWRGLRFYQSSIGTLEHIEVRHADKAIHGMEQGSMVTVRNAVLRDGNYGVYVYTPYSEIEVENALITGNRLSGVFVRADSREVFRNCTITGNGYDGTGWDGAGIHLGAANLTLENTIVAFNRTELHHSGDTPQLTIRNSLFFNNESGRILLWDEGRNDPIPDLHANGSIVADPRFVQSSLGEYELDALSPAVDSGFAGDVTSTDILGRPRFDDPGIANTGDGFPAFVDLGTFERQTASEGPDLVVVDVSYSAPTSIPPGGTLTVDWVIENTGQVTSVDTWSDALYLSDDPQADPDTDQLLATRIHHGTLAAGTSYAESWTGAIPSGSIGSQYVVVRTNHSDAFAESVLVNNTKSTQTPIAINVNELRLDVPQADTLDESAWQYYAFEAAGNASVRFAIDAVASSGTMELYVSRGKPPTQSAYDVAGALPNQLDQEARLFNPVAGTYYVGIFAADLPGGDTQFTVSAEQLTFDLLDVTPRVVGNAATATIELLGNNFTPDTEVQLVDGGRIVEAGEFFQDAGTIFATFNLAAQAVPAGTYDVVVTIPGIGSAIETGALTVTTGGTPQLEANLIVPELARPGRKIDVQIEYSNTGNVDLPSPMFTVASIEDLLWGIPSHSKMVISLLPVRTVVDTVSILGISDDGPASILRPGQSTTLTLEVTTPFHTGDLPFELSVWGLPDSEGLDDPIDWAAFEQDVRPADSFDDEWNPLFARLKTQVGGVWDDFLAMLRDNANHLAEISLRTYDADTLFAFEWMQAAAMGTPGYLEAEQDAFCPGTGISLSLGRQFLPAPTYRARVGALGRGWTHSYEITLVERADGLIITNGPGGVDRVFSLDADGRYSGTAGDLATLAADGTGFRLTEKSGFVTRFDASGQLDYLEEPDGNRVTATHDTSGRLTRVTHTSGDHFDFAYYANGRLRQVTDHAGRLTTYAYDASGEHLLSVNTIDGETTSYAYVTGDGLLRDHHLSSITYPGGLAVSYDYDILGRLIGHHVGAGEESVTYSYSTAGKTFIQDALGNTTTFWLDSDGRIARVENPLKAAVDLHYDANSNLLGVIGPLGTSAFFTYDSQNNLTASEDPSGFVTQFGYETTHANLEWFRDARGNITRYAYDAAGNMTSITYSDDTVEHFAYDAAGNFDSWTNRRNETIDYTHNARGQLTEKAWPDGTTFTYAHDALGRLTTTTDAHGDTTFDYDADTNRLTRITYPTGRWLAYQYNALGQRTQMVDQDGFTTNYHYDTAGRLHQLTDATGANIVTYTYDAAGRLSREDKGNNTYTTYQYDAAGQILSLKNHAPDDTIQSHFDYTYDPLGRRTRMQTHYGTWTYAYDASSQLTHALLDSTDPTIPNQDLQYIYDPLGNRIETITNGVTTPYTTNAMNQYTQVGNAIYTYDADGNMTSKTTPSGTWTYIYNPENRLIGVVTPDGIWDYTYDPLGNRSAVVEDGGRTEYQIDPFGLGDVVAEYGNTSSLIAKYVHGLGLVSQVDVTGAAAYYAFDALGSTSEMTGADGIPTAICAWSPFGTALGQLDKFGFVGRFGVMQESNGLIYMRARHFTSALGSFISKDPIGLESGSIHMRSYCGNDPVDYSDPSGLIEWDSAKKVLSKVQTTFSAAEDGIEHVVPKKFIKSLVEKGLSSPRSIQKLSRINKVSAVFGSVESGVSIATSINKGDYLQAIHDFGLFGSDLLSTYKPLWWFGWFARGWDIATLRMSEKFWLWWDNRSVSVSTSHTPEDKLGPTGYDTPGTSAGSEMRYVPTGQMMDYRIEFWNEPTATMSTQDAVIEDVIDPSVFDLDTFEFTRFGFLDWDVPLPAGTRSIDQTVDMRPTFNLMVDVKGNFDAVTGKADWWFHCFDPDTGDYPADPMYGFLPPFDPETKYELGWVEIAVNQKANLPTGTRIENRAYVEFDFLGDINEHPAPKAGPWVNTIDAAGPTSHVEPLLATSSQANFPVTWSGTDDTGGSGIGSYDIYMAIDNGPMLLWLENTTDTEVLFVASPGHAYAFQSIAIDNVGHREPAPATPDAWTEVLGSSTSASVIAIVRDMDIPPADPHGESDALPDGLEWFDEWTPCFVEIWSSTLGSNDVGLAGFSADLRYDTGYFTVADISQVEPGPAFEPGNGTFNPSIDVANSLVHIAGTTTLTDAGDDRYVLLARVTFEPSAANNAQGAYITPTGSGFSLENVQNEAVGLGTITADVPTQPDSELWPMMYDIDDNGRVDFGDLAYFANAFQQNVTDPGATYAYASDFDRSGKVDFGDLAYFAANFLRETGDGKGPLRYPTDFPNAWQTAPLMLAATTPPQHTAETLTKEQLVSVTQAAVARVDSTIGNEQTAAILHDIRFEIVDLPDNLLGRHIGQSTIQIDLNAAGHGWFVDTTPWSDQEFIQYATELSLSAIPNTEASTRVDLLTTVMHELNHVLGFGHSGENDLMAATLPLGTRRPLESEFDLFADEFDLFSENSEKEWEADMFSQEAVDEVFALL